MARSASIRPKARILQLLGDELIGSPRIAVFELVKNAYDADATKVVVTLENLGTDEASVTVRDNGSGMTGDIIQNIWLTPANDHRRKQRESGKRSPLGRLPLGEKGLGRFAVHKLGNKIRMVTRQAGKPEVVVKLDWSELLSHDFLDEISVPIEERTPKIFKSKTHGTKIDVTDLRGEWSRGAIRDLHRSLTSIADPTSGPSDFQVQLKIPGNEKVVADLLDAGSVLEQAMWKFDFTFDGSEIAWTYEFKPYPGIKVEPSTQSGKEPLLRDRDKKDVVAGKDMIAGIGPVSGGFNVFDRDRATWNFIAQKKVMTEYLNNNGGVRVYRDGIRVYNYGEPNDDWLGLDIRRVNSPVDRLSRNQILGRINLTLAGSHLLREKTNREGFVENSALERLKEIVMSAMTIFDRLRRPHREAIRAALTGVKSPLAISIDTPVARLKAELTNNKLDRLQPLVDEIGREYDQLREIMLSSGNAGLQLSLIFHELERGVRGLYDAIRQREKIEDIEERSRYLKDLLEGFATVLKKEPARKQSLAKIAREAMFLNNLRFKKHRVAIDFPLGRGDQPDVMVRASLGLAIGGVSNAIDNAIFWTRVRWPDEQQTGELQRKIWVGTSDEFGDPALIVADNGPGFRDSPDDLIRPFWTRRPGGMGLGLYYANLAMELSGGKLLFPQPADLELPEWVTGAVVAFVFKGA
ncbi:ATP-binding protein [Bradyrhizobium sp. 188]|uniref:ATP-binding protein n=1 Tax=Bradyrhizobium sp. 188 TaxID=2782656 RepID=UPI001FFA3A1F|nr:ATP-binding protein [Bradyrhizobium sp. 188]MCK1497901.1 ATP-binding protein [Bradyrhizobium sp. 188]